MLQGLRAGIARHARPPHAAPGGVALDYGCGSRPIEELFTAAGMRYLACGFRRRRRNRHRPSRPAQDRRPQLRPGALFPGARACSQPRLYLSEAGEYSATHGAPCCFDPRHLALSPTPRGPSALDARRANRRAVQPWLPSHRMHSRRRAAGDDHHHASDLRELRAPKLPALGPLLGAPIGSAHELARAWPRTPSLPRWVKQENACVYLVLARPQLDEAGMAAGAEPRYLAVAAAVPSSHNADHDRRQTVGVHYLSSSVVSFVLVALSGYVLHAHFTFRASPSARSLLRYALAMAGNYPLSIALLFVLCDLLGTSVMLAAPLATGDPDLLQFPAQPAGPNDQAPAARFPQMVEARMGRVGPPPWARWPRTLTPAHPLYRWRAPVYQTALLRSLLRLWDSAHRTVWTSVAVTVSWRMHGTLLPSIASPHRRRGPLPRGTRRRDADLRWPAGCPSPMPVSIACSVKHAAPRTGGRADGCSASAAEFRERCTLYQGPSAARERARPAAAGGTGHSATFPSAAWSRRATFVPAEWRRWQRMRDSTISAWDYARLSKRPDASIVPKSARSVDEVDSEHRC